MSIKDHKLKELLPLSLTSTPAVSIREENKVWVATAMLVHYLESFTDSLVVTDSKNEPIGVMGGYEIIKNVFELPTSELFDEKYVRDVMDDGLLQVASNTTLAELIEKWKETHRAFCILPNEYGGYSAISARKILEIGANCETNITISSLPQKRLAIFSSQDPLGQIINSMMENRTRKIIKKDLCSFISDRTIIQTIARDLDYLRNTEDFLDMKIESTFQLEKMKKITDDLKISELSRMMFGMMHPYVLYNDQVYTPWDICIGLLSNDIKLK